HRKRANIQSGLKVKIVLKKDQRSGILENQDNFYLLSLAYL
ncbi:MAG TPA: DUF2196 domain-containing protein, partial [Campylobacterales bacterium]|nr:DUF2196 domain-containing protein [Campylobacterales bacterium]